MTFTVEVLSFFGGLAKLTRQVFAELFERPFYWRLTVDQIFHIGVQSLPLVIIVCGSTGMVMALQFGHGLAKFGGQLYVPKIVSLSIARELGPVLASLMIAARVGAGITSEVGSMKVTQQIDAIRALGTSHIKKIVIPRLLASIIAIPLLSTIGTAIGIMGGVVVGTFDLNIDPHFYYQKILYTLVIADFLSGFFKTFVFAFLIALSSCYIGLKSRGGTQGVGIATTKSVVISGVLIMIGNYFLTKFFLVVESWL